MTIYRFFERDANRGGKIDRDLAREYTRTYDAWSNSKLDGPLEIQNHRDCPEPWKTKSDWDNVAICVDNKFEYRPKTRYKWTVTSTFSTVQLNAPPNDDPLQDPVDVDVKTTIEMKERFTNRNGQPYTNAAGDLIKVMRPVPETTITISRNIPTKYSWIKQIRGVINSKPVRIEAEQYPAFTLMVWGVSITKTEYRNGKPFKPCQLTLKYDPDGWVSPALNVGFNELIEDPSGTKTKNGKIALIKVPCLDEFGQPVTSAVFLDKKGMRPREKFKENGIVKLRPKTILLPKDIVLLNLDQMDLLDFDRYLPIK